MKGRYNLNIVKEPVDTSGKEHKFRYELRDPEQVLVARDTKTAKEIYEAHCKEHNPVINFVKKIEDAKTTVNKI